MRKTTITLLITSCIAFTGSFLHAQKTDSIVVTKPLDSIAKSSKEEKNRNVMLNADSNTGPRQVNIGLPFGSDVLILENGLPVVYNYFPTIPTTTWRYDSSISKIGLLSFSEGALTFGKVGFVVDSYDREVGNSVKGFGSAYTNSFGSLRYDVSVGAPIGKKGWGISLGAYESYDRGNGTNFQFIPWQDRTEIFKAGISKKYSKGSIRVLYKHSVARNVNLGNAYYPFIYRGKGKFDEVPGFQTGTDSYILNTGLVPYYDPNTGVAGREDIASDSGSKSLMDNIYVIGDHKFNNGWKLTYSTLYQASTASFDSEFPISIAVKDADQQLGQQYKYQGTGNIYTGPVQLVQHINFPDSYGRFSATRAEMSKTIKGNELRIGATYQYSATKYDQHNATYFQTVEANPKLLDLYAFVPAANAYFLAGNQYGGLAASSGGYGNKVDYTFSKTALYGSYDMKIGSRVELGVGGRIEHQNIHDEHNPYINDFIKDRPMAVHDFKNKFNKVGLANVVVKVTSRFGILADGTYNSWYDRIWDYQYRDANGNPIPDPATPAAKPLQNVPVSYQISVLNLGAGVYYNIGDKFSLVSKITSIKKSNIYATATVTNPLNLQERSSFDPILYDISTLGWSTDIVAQPFKNAAVHFLFTLQNPKYKDYSYGAFGVNYNYSDNIIPGLSKVLMELDPSYTFLNGSLKAWVSLRYFGKQYGNPTNSIYYKGWLENFGGLDYRVSRKLDFKLQVTNFLDKRGVKGTLQGADQITNDASFIDRKLVASAIRPRTIEFTVNFKF